MESEYLTWRGGCYTDYDTFMQQWPTLDLDRNFDHGLFEEEDDGGLPDTLNWLDVSIALAILPQVYPEWQIVLISCDYTGQPYSVFLLGPDMQLHRFRSREEIELLVYETEPE